MFLPAVCYNWVAVHMTPEQIDRQPFRTTKRGYDIVQVRNFLREIADEMRERQSVRTQLAANGEDTAVAEHQAHQILEDARKDAAEIIAIAEVRAGSADALDTASDRAGEIVAEAEREAATMIEDAEARARQRSDEVISAAQARLDQLLEEEREVSARVEVHRAELEPPAPKPIMSDSRDVITVEMPPDTSLADFMKSTLRHEVHPE